jgi:hypothetical protein
MADKFIRLNNGKLAETEATDTSTGVAEAGDIVALDSSGKLDVSLLPTGIGADVAVITASENLSAGDYVNIFDNSGTPNVRLADNSNGRDAHGFVKDAVTASSPATVYFEGSNDALSSLTPGARYYLGTAGGVTSTAPVAPGADISQFVGIAIADDTINTDIDDCIGLA